MRLHAMMDWMGAQVVVVVVVVVGGGDFWTGLGEFFRIA
jgi:hypothetical protein